VTLMVSPDLLRRIMSWPFPPTSLSTPRRCLLKVAGA
jgi:hypothetical protein